MMATLIIVNNAKAQTAHPDIPLNKVGEIYTMSCMAPSDTDLKKVCFVRTDMSEIIEYGCVDAQPDTVATMTFTVGITQDDDAEIKCYASDETNIPSDYSDNSGTIDFTRPGKPYVVFNTEPIAARTRSANQMKTLTLEVIN